MLVSSYRNHSTVSTRTSANSEERAVMPVLLIGTLDTKGTEVEYLRDLLNRSGVETLTTDICRAPA